MTLNFNALKKRFIPEEALALTLESGRIAATLVTPENGARELFSIPTGAEALVADPEKAGKELAAALSAAGVRQRRCVVCVPPAWALTAPADLPEIAPEDLRSFLELRAEREFPISADELRIAHSPYLLPDGTRRTTIAAIPSKRMEAVEKMLAAAGCRAVSVSLALDECLTEPKAALHFLANGTHTNVIVTAGGGVVSMRSLASPGPLPETPFDATAFYREVRITLGRLPEPIRQQVREARFSGTPASAKRLCAATSDQLLQLGIESVDCAEIKGGDDQKSSAPAAAVKAAQCYLRKQPVAFEFVVPEVNKWEVALQRANLSGRRRLIAIAGVVIVLPILAFFIRGQIEGYYTRRWNRMKDNYMQLDALQQKIHTYRPWFEPTPITVQTLEGLISVFPEQGEVWAKNIHITQDGKVTCTGFTKSQAALLAMHARLRAHAGVTDVQILSERGDSPIQFSITFNYDPHQ
jgi:hypothetical protein